MTNAELISGTRLLLRSLTDDSIFTDQAIYDQHINARSFLLTRRIKQMQNIGSANYLRACISLEPGNYDNCDCDDFDCTVARSTIKLPIPLQSRANEILTVSAVDGTPINKLPLGGAPQYKTSLLGRKSKLAWEIYNGYLLIHGNVNIPRVLIKGIFHDPIKVAAISDCENFPAACYNPQLDNFPIDPDLINPMRDYVIKSLGLTAKMQDDVVNNTIADNNV